MAKTSGSQNGAEEVEPLLSQETMGQSRHAHALCVFGAPPKKGSTSRAQPIDGRRWAPARNSAWDAEDKTFFSGVGSVRAHRRVFWTFKNSCLVKLFGATLDACADQSVYIVRTAMSRKIAKTRKATIRRARTIHCKSKNNRRSNNHHNNNSSSKSK